MVCGETRPKGKYGNKAKNMKKSIADNVRELNARIEAAAQRAGREPGAVTLLAAVKNRDAREILEAAEAGIRVVGENRAQELLDRMGEVGDKVEWHFIGHLQRNKARYIVDRVSLLHSLDSVALAVELDRRAGLSRVRLPVLLQVNMAAEESKSGFGAREVNVALSEIAKLTNLRVRGLSTIAPLVGDPEQVRWVFRGLRELSDLLEGEPGFDGGVLSMGMTGDFEVAVEEGANIVRIGTAIFESG